MLSGVWIQWTGVEYWTTGLLYWTGLLDWTTGLDYYRTGLLDWTTTGLDYWTDLDYIHTHLRTYTYIEHVAQSLRPWLVTWVGRTVVILSKSIHGFKNVVAPYFGGGFSYTGAPIAAMKPSEHIKRKLYSKEFLLTCQEATPLLKEKEGDLINH